MWFLANKSVIITAVKIEGLSIYAAGSSTITSA